MSTARTVNAGIRLMAAWKVVRRAASYSALNALLGQPAAQRLLPHAAAGRGLRDRRLGQERQNRLFAHGGGFGPVAERARFSGSSALVCAHLGGVGCFGGFTCDPRRGVRRAVSHNQMSA